MFPKGDPGGWSRRRVLKGSQWVLRGYWGVLIKTKGGLAEGPEGISRGERVPREVTRGVPVGYKGF